MISFVKVAGLKHVKLRLSSKIALLVAILFATSIVFGAIAYIQLEGVNTAAAELRSHWLPRSQTFAKMILVGHRFRLNESIMITAPTSNHYAEIMRLEMLGREIADVFAAQRKVAQSDTERSALAAMTTNWTAYLDLHRRLINFINSGDSASATILYREDMRDLMRSFQDQIWNEVASDIANGELAAKTSEILGDRARFAILARMLIALAIASIVGYSLWRTVSKPIRVLTHAMTAALADEPEIEIPYLDCDDEIGQMARAAKVFKDDAQAKRSRKRRTSDPECDRVSAECLQAHGDLAEAMQRLGAALNWLATGPLSQTQVDGEDCVAAHSDLRLAIGKLQDAMRVVVASSRAVLANPHHIGGVLHDPLDSQVSPASPTPQNPTAAGSPVKHNAAAMDALTKALHDLCHIIDITDEITFHTNLLTLNSEARNQDVDDPGKTSAPLASEVSALAQRSSEAAKQITALIASPHDQLATGVILFSEI